MSRFEVVRTDAEQPWHARLMVNNKRVWWTENYARKVGAERAIRSNGKALAGMFAALLAEYADDVFWRKDSAFSADSNYAYKAAGSKLRDFADRLPVAYLDERQARP